jgi:Uma2 family endonuclease
MSVVENGVVKLTEHRSIILRSRIRGVPDLVVEIVSPSTGERDRSLKRSLYEKSGVPEYWVVDAEERLVERYVLGGAAYAEAEIHREEISFADARIDLTDIWSRL